MILKAHPAVPGLHQINFPTQKGLTSTFLRFAEHYESSSPKFRNQIFTRRQFLAYYRKKHGTNYFTDWRGYNIPGHVFLPFFECCFHPLTKDEQRLLDQVEPIYRKHEKFYVIGLYAGHDAEMHEVAHALFYLDHEYRKTVSRIVLNAPQTEITKLEQWLLKKGYCEDVLIDECQAYLLEIDYLIKKKRLKVHELRKTSEKLTRNFKQRTAQ